KTWGMAVDWIRQSPIFGYGYEWEALLISKFGGNNTATHCHNLYLDLLYRTGIVGLGAFLVMLWRCARPLKRHKHDSLSILLSFTLFLYLAVLFQMEAYFNLTLFYMLLTFGFTLEHWAEKEVLT
ncbi:MAG: O-antigen ligase family protein, partial [Oscillospiraceae bacterium]|nr:O-antigen ligase family protein [Oscillospiraceae bacterium]